MDLSSYLTSLVLLLPIRLARFVEVLTQVFPETTNSRELGVARLGIRLWRAVTWATLIDASR